jgi:hypothetical protein
MDDVKLAQGHFADQIKAAAATNATQRFQELFQHHALGFSPGFAGNDRCRYA